MISGVITTLFILVEEQVGYSWKCFCPLTETDLQEMTRRIVAAANPVKVMLFGSRARGRLGSDVDLLEFYD